MDGSIIYDEPTPQIGLVLLGLNHNQLNLD